MRALIIANEYLSAEVDRLRSSLSVGYVRGRLPGHGLTPRGYAEAPASICGAQVIRPHFRVRRTDRYLDAPGGRGYHARSPRIACDRISTKGSLLPHRLHLARCLTSPRVN